MRKFIPVLALASASLASPALAETWREVTRVGNLPGYIDTDSIKRDGDKVRFRLEVRFPVTQTARTGHNFDRIASTIEIDCPRKTYRLLRIGAKVGEISVFGGKSPDRSVRPVQPDTAAHAEMRAVCFDDWPKGG